MLSPHAAEDKVESGAIETMRIVHGCDKGRFSGLCNSKDSSRQIAVDPVPRRVPDRFEIKGLYFRESDQFASFHVAHTISK